MSKQKIVITGICGYLGTELARLYSGEARYKEIIGIDNRFLAERVAQLKHWGIKFIHGSILDEALMQDTLKGADLVYHLAGITDVAYTKTESNVEKDREIRAVGGTGTNNVIESILKNKKCKLVFPSTHVLFEGLAETKFDLDEESEVSPILTYSKVKRENELTITMNSEYHNSYNYAIVRLGSVYGYSQSDTMRINIMPNLFSKIAASNGTISLFSGGVQHKSLVALQDVVRAMKHLGEGDYKGIYHLSNENMTIKEVAQICKDINPNVTLVETDNEIPNLGYTLSNKKLLDTGFKFLYNIHDEIEKMISVWSDKELLQKEAIHKHVSAFRDKRGIIKNYELTEPINLIGYIESKKGTVRANHYHPQQEQKCLLISGSYVSVTKDLHNNGDIETRLIKSGDIAIIPANIAHTMVFLEDSIFLNLVNGDRDFEKYGVTHTIPYELVSDTLRDDILNHYKTECRVCGNNDLKDFVTLGLSPLANNLTNEGEQAHVYPLELKRCTECKNVQLSMVVPAPEMFDNYLYVSSTSEVFRKHFERAALSYFEQFNLNDKSLVVDIGSNDGVFLKPLRALGVMAVGVEPAKNLVQKANENGLRTLQGYFDNHMAGKIIGSYGRADIVTASNVFAHADNVKDITDAAFRLLKPNGVFIIEVQYLYNTVEDLTFDNIYHEHVNYWCVTSLNNLFNRLGYCLYKVEYVDTHGGSIRVYVNRKGEQEESVQDYINQEKFIKHIDALHTFGNKIATIKQNAISNFAYLKDNFLKIAAYGSPAKATTALNYFGITDISYTIEDNELKHDKYIPGVQIPIRSKEYALKNIPGIVIVLAWNFFDSIVANNKDLTDRGVLFISIKDLQKDPSEFEDSILSLTSSVS